MRVRAKPWAINEFASSPFFIQDGESLSDIFDNNNPIHIEIGCGKGQFITKTALKNPHINYLGIEKQERIACLALKTAREAWQNQPQNLYFFVGEAEKIEDYFNACSIERIYINFCDPWRSRAKWHKRRLTHRNFLEKYKKIMPKGEIHLKTDAQDLFNFSISEFKSQNWELLEINNNLHAYENDHIKTEYEEKFIQLGKPIYHLIAKNEVQNCY